MALVQSAGTFGYIDKTGRVVSTPRLTSAGALFPQHFADQRDPVEIGGRFDYIDKAGNVVIPLQLEGVCSL
jgi:hypothetical protein